MGNLEEVLLNRELQPFKVFTGASDPKNILEEVINKVYPPDEVYKFNSGIKADFLGHIPVENPDSKNYFGAYNRNINKALQVIKGLLIDALSYYDLSSKVGYYLSSDYSDSVRTDVWYDMGGVSVPCFSGVYFIESSEESTTSVNGDKYFTPKGTILLFEAGKRIVYGEENIKILTFSIAPIPLLEKQYPQKWLPLL
jgi:hypothetical protein